MAITPRQRVLIAKNLISIAHMIYAAKDDTDDAKAAKSKIEAGLKVVSAGKAKFEAANKTIVDEIKRLEQAKKDLEAQQKTLTDALKEEFKKFDAENHITESAKTVSTVLSDLMSTGTNVTDLIASLGDAEKALVQAKESERPSYKGAYEMLVSMLNGSEFEKYVQLIEGGFKKNLVEVERAIGLTKTATASFNQDYKKEYEAHAVEWLARHPNNPLPKLKASAPVEGSVRTAGLISLLKEIGGWIKGVFSAAVGKLMTAIRNLAGMSRDMAQMNAFFGKVNRAAKAVKA